MHRFAPLGLSVLLFAAPAGAQRGTYLVRAGDTLAEIARRHRVTVEALEEANDLRRESIRPGERLRIPGPGESGRGVPARRYRVQEGDTLARIARRRHVTVQDLLDANARRDGRLRPGELLWIPERGHSGAEIRERTRTGNPAVVEDERPELSSEETEAVRRRVEELGLGPARVAQRLFSEAPDPRWIEAAGAPDALDGTLEMPVEGGRYLRGWGSGVEGYHLAVDVGAPPGTDIRAAERGLVAYAGHGIRGYGNLVVLVHANGWVTAYAHARQNLVVPGQIVERGQLLSRVGQTGYARGPHLHFMLVHEGRHCDPVPLLRPRMARADGEEVDALELVWDTEHRPSGIRCLFRSEAPHPYRHWHTR
jgi:murein DD-endopeptidase MepM/ murein hydrolase activator NlpD